MDNLLSGFLDAGVLGSTVAVLWFSHWKLQQRIDTMARSFAETVTALQDKQQAREDQIRERYDRVLAEHIADRDRLRDSLETKLSKVAGMMETGLSEMRQHYQEAKLHALAKGKGGSK